MSGLRAEDYILEKSIPPEPPKNRLICTFCGDITDTEEHTSWMCRLVIWLRREKNGF